MHQRGFPVLATVVLTGVLTGACGSRQPDLEPPTVDIIELSINAAEGTARLRLDNPVAAPLPASAVSFEMLIADESLGSFEPTFDLTVPPLGSETLTVRFDATAAAARRLQQADPARLAYSLRGELRLESGRVLAFDQAGWLTPTPGKPGSWR